jgi:hypothetical protein
LLRAAQNRLVLWLQTGLLRWEAAQAGDLRKAEAFTRLLELLQIGNLSTEGLLPGPGCPRSQAVLEARHKTNVLNTTWQLLQDATQVEKLVGLLALQQPSIFRAAAKGQRAAVLDPLSATIHLEFVANTLVEPVGGRWAMHAAAAAGALVQMHVLQMLGADLDLPSLDYHHWSGVPYTPLMMACSCLPGQLNCRFSLQAPTEQQQQQPQPAEQQQQQPQQAEHQQQQQPPQKQEQQQQQQQRRQQQQKDKGEDQSKTAGASSSSTSTAGAAPSGDAAGDSDGAGISMWQWYQQQLQQQIQYEQQLLQQQPRLQPANPKGKYEPFLLTASGKFKKVLLARLEVVKFLVKAGVNVNYVANTRAAPQVSALTLAADAGLYPVVELLLPHCKAAAPDLSALAADQQLLSGPLQRACLTGNVKTLKLLVAATGGPSSPEAVANLCLMAVALDLEAVKLMLAEGVPVNKRVDRGVAPLHAFVCTTSKGSEVGWDT